MLTTFLATAVFCSLCFAQEMTKAENKSQWINQNKTIHPPITELKLTMAMLKLVDVVEVEEKITFLFDYIAEYTDYRLKWNPLEYGGISHIYVPQKSIWLPEITIADAHEVKFFESDDAPRTAWINYNGTAGFYTSTVASVICQLDGNGEWKVTYIGVAEENNGNLGETQRFIARFQRNPSFYVALVMVPAYFINFLSIIALFINIENVGEKITVGLTNIMAMTFILVILAADLPKTARIPLLAIYVIVGLVIVMASIGVVLVLPYVRKYQAKRNKNQEKVLDDQTRSSTTDRSASTPLPYAL
ncbi:Protein CBG10414 [Caenorhabditis briggsae]|uniref:Protein CBG10414 n=1 Tax=Caenorhabditis briggsae TaxID=6238 RepID=A8XB55_CAEBR|nr:Protein CBG10414 [Caenorhabditis briggsae]CAP29835.1 Protein CBG10414 [Caenorhabditis briggsae]